MSENHRFSGYLRAARERKGMTQAALASACGLTGSYVSLLESGRKPAPSDVVVQRMAKVLGLPRDEALHVAHLDRAPEDLKRSVARLRRDALQERQLRDKTAAALFPLSIWNLPMGGTSRHVPVGDGASGVGTGIVAILSRLATLARLAPDLPTFRDRTMEVLEQLDPEERRKVLDAAPALAEQAAADAPWWAAPEGGLPPSVLPGDRILVDETASPRPGDVVLLVEGETSRLATFAPGMASVKGVVVEVRRRLRRPPA